MDTFCEYDSLYALGAGIDAVGFGYVALCLENMRVLVISSHYRVYIKELVDTTAKSLEEINLIFHHNYLSEIVSLLPFSYSRMVKGFTKEKLVDLNAKPNNVNIHTISLFYIIPDGKNNILGDILFSKFNDYIKKSNIKFDIIHAHQTWPCGYAAVKLGKVYKKPVVITGHGYDVYDLPFRDKKWGTKIIWTLTGADAVITVSYRNKSIIVDRLGIPDEKVFVIPNGFSPAKFPNLPKDLVMDKLEIPCDKKIILTVGNLVPIKGHEFLIKAIEQVTKEEKQIQLIVLGDGPLKNKLQALCRKLGVENYVRFLGNKPHSEIPLWMNASDLFVLPSLNEGNPTVMFEALGVGLPFVGTKVGGIPEIITSEDYGLLAEPGNVEDLAEKLQIALDKQWDRGMILDYAQQFTWDRLAERLLKIYEGAIKR